LDLLKQYSKYHYSLHYTTFGFTPVFTATGLSTASIGFKTTTVAVAFVQLTGSAPVSHSLISDAIGP
jgi:hypothetical protein